MTPPSALGKNKASARHSTHGWTSVGLAHSQANQPAKDWHLVLNAQSEWTNADEVTDEF